MNYQPEPFAGYLTVPEVVVLTGRPQLDVVRACVTGVFMQARHDTQGRWRVPVGDLVAAGWPCMGLDSLVDAAPMDCDPVALLGRATDVLAHVVRLWQATHLAFVDDPDDPRLPADAIDRATGLLTDATRNWNLAAQLYAEAT